MPAPSDPEKYSIDDMMERLKTRSAEDPIEDGELVTRSDGSQAIRVRKKKRRTRQPHKEERRNHRRTRILQVSAVLIFLLLALFGAGFAVVYANSAPFRENLVRKITLASGASAELRQFRMNPTSANATNLTLTWPEGNVLQTLTLRTIKADLSLTSFLGNAMSGEEVIGGEGTLTLRAPKAGEPFRAVPVPDGVLPIRFKQFNIPKFHLLLGEPAAPQIRMRDSEATFIPKPPTGGPQLLLNRGDILIPGWPKLRLDRSHIEFRGQEVDIVGMRLRHETDSRGVFMLSGTVSPYATEQPSELAIALESYLVSGIAGPELGRLVSGRIDTIPAAGSNFLSFTPGPGSATSLSITFSNSPASPIEVVGFPFLFGLSQTLDDEWFSRPVFDSEIHGVLGRDGGTVSLRNLNFEHKGRMAMRGSISMTPEKRLSGALEIGVAEGMIQTAGNSRLEAMFGPPVGGFRWVSLAISGSANSPTDNFKDLYDAAAASSAPAAPDGGIPSFEDLTRPE